ncbi:TadE/TadG family type IV pilus assembly protein [Microvirga sp. KLBC 81]|uniref:TadE/TadG family type IV pilus assembly protein n=1 Tax=Microvirga sp. KLBC 81 TaxID=1862707 RepID=UPI001403C45F|nr:TadE/TadG family type IV pilus assembly protein [Microvirga sp. KLBC 81]
MAVEFAFIGLLLIAGSLIAIDFGRAFYLYNKVSNAMDRAARKSLVFNASNEQLIAEIMKDFPKFVITDPSQYPDEIPKVTVVEDTDFRSVKADVIFRPVVPAFVSDKVTMSLTRRLPKAS